MEKKLVRLLLSEPLPETTIGKQFSSKKTLYSIFIRFKSDCIITGGNGSTRNQRDRYSLTQKARIHYRLGTFTFQEMKSLTKLYQSLLIYEAMNTITGSGPFSNTKPCFTMSDFLDRQKHDFGASFDSIFWREEQVDVPLGDSYSRYAVELPIVSDYNRNDVLRAIDLLAREGIIQATKVKDELCFVIADESLRNLINEAWRLHLSIWLTKYSFWQKKRPGKAGFRWLEDYYGKEQSEHVRRLYAEDRIKYPSQSSLLEHDKRMRAIVLSIKESLGKYSISAMSPEKQAALDILERRLLSLSVFYEMNGRPSTMTNYFKNVRNFPPESWRKRYKELKENSTANKSENLALFLLQSII